MRDFTGIYLWFPEKESDLTYKVLAVRTVRFKEMGCRMLACQGLGLWVSGSGLP